MREVVYDEIREQKSFLDIPNIGDEVDTRLPEMREPRSLFSESPDSSAETPANEVTDEVAPRKTFWRRQFQATVTAAQQKFDWLFGVVMPLICFAFDPIVFYASDGGGILTNYTIFSYILSIVSIMSMAAWLIWRERLGWLTPFIAGLFLTGSLVSLVVGMIIFPISLLATIFLIGALGFTPLFTAFVYFRNAIRAFSSYDFPGEVALTERVFILSAIFCLVIPFVINFQFVHPSVWLPGKGFFS